MERSGGSRISRFLVAGCRAEVIHISDHAPWVGVENSIFSAGLDASAPDAFHAAKTSAETAPKTHLKIKRLRVILDWNRILKKPFSQSSILSGSPGLIAASLQIPRLEAARKSNRVSFAELEAFSRRVAMICRRGWPSRKIA